MKQSSGLAAVFVGANKKMAIREYPVTPPRCDDVFLSLARSGLCGTDIHILEGRLAVPPPFIVGHEFIGTVRGLGQKARHDGLGHPLRMGDSAIACVADPCGACFTCAQGETASCLHFGVTNFRDPEKKPHFFGGFGEFLYQPAAGVVRVPRSLNLDAVAAFPCAGPTAIRAFDFAGNLKRGELVVVQGTGPVGLFTVAWAVKAGCKVIAIGSSSNPLRLRMAKELGASLVLDYRKTTAERRAEMVTAMAARLRRGNGADVVFEASGAPSAIPEGLGLVRTLGRYIVPGQYSDSGTVAIAPQLITFKAIKIVGSGQYKLDDIDTYLRFLQAHADLQRKFARCITHRYAVKNANRAWANASKGVSIKAVFSA